MSKIVEYSVRRVERYIVTRYYHESLPNGMCHGGCEGIGLFENFAQADCVGKSLAEADPGAKYRGMPEPIV